MIIDNLKRNIVRKAQEKHLKIGSLERMANMGNGALRQVFYGNSKNPGLLFVKKIADILDCSIDELVADGTKDAEISTKSLVNIRKQDLPIHSSLLTEICRISSKYIIDNSYKATLDEFFDLVKDVYIFSINKGYSKANSELIAWTFDKHFNKELF